MCSQLSTAGVTSVFSTAPNKASDAILRSFSEQFQVPYISASHYFPPENSKKYQFSVTIRPKYIDAILALRRLLGWKKLTYIVDGDEGRSTDETYPWAESLHLWSYWILLSFRSSWFFQLDHSKIMKDQSGIVNAPRLPWQKIHTNHLNETSGQFVKLKIKPVVQTCLAFYIWKKKIPVKFRWFLSWVGNVMYIHVPQQLG